MSRLFLQVATGIVILLSWLASLLTGLFTHDYQGLQLVTPIMVIYAGYVYGTEFIKKKINGNGNGDTK
jgi:uncharacterized membrane protein